MAGVALQIIQIIASIMQKQRLHDSTGDPWDGRTLEWAVASPPPSYNFTVIPEVHERDAYYEMKQRGLPKTTYEDIHIPKNTASGIYIAIFAFLVGFGFVWEIVWLVVVSLVGILVCVILRTFNDELEYTLTAAEVKQLEDTRAKKERQLHAVKSDNDEDMGLREFVSIALTWIGDVIKEKRWRAWR